MAKRFIDTELFNDDWFMDLSKDAKLLYIYLITKCNHAGIIKLNKRLTSFQTGIKEIDTVIELLGNRCETVNGDSNKTYFLPKFIKFQYPNFPKSNVKQQESALKILKEYGIKYNTTTTVTELSNESYDNGSDSVSVIEHGKDISKIEKLFISTWQRKPKNLSEIMAVEKMFVDYSEKHIVQAFRRAAEQDVLKVAYVKGILKKHYEKMASDKEIKEAKKKKLESLGVKI